MEFPEATPWYVALVVALMGATLAALKPFIGWAERQYDRSSEHRRALEREQIDQIRRLSDAVAKLTCVVEGLHASVDSMLRELARMTLQRERQVAPEKEE